MYVEAETWKRDTRDILGIATRFSPAGFRGHRFPRGKVRHHEQRIDRSILPLVLKPLLRVLACRHGALPPLLLRPGEPSSGVGRQMVARPLLVHPHDVQPSETPAACPADELLLYPALILPVPVQGVLDGIPSAASRATIAENRF